MKINIAIFIAFLVLNLTACEHATKESTTYPVDDIKVTTNTYSFYKYKQKSYEWADVVQAINDPEGRWTAPEFDVKRHIKKSIKEELNKYELNEVSTSADIRIAYGIGFDMTTLNLKNYSEIKPNMSLAALTIAIVDKKTRKVIWMATANGEYKKLEAEIAKKRVDYAIKEMFKRFPG